MTRMSMVGGLLLLASALEAQPKCRKGKPCGNSCIAVSKTCRVGTPAQRKPQSPSHAPPSEPPPATLLALPGAATTFGDTLLPWVVSAIGATYFASACAGAAQIPPDSRMYYRSAENLNRMGMSRASAKREACTRAQMQEHERRVAATVH